MRIKKRWITTANPRQLDYLEDLGEIIAPLFKRNGAVTLNDFDREGAVDYLLALILNCEFVQSKDTEIRSFGADDIIVLDLEIEKHKLLKCWGKIVWLAIPPHHICHRSYQDPFYGEFMLTDDGIGIKKMMFGTYDILDLDGPYWIKSEVNWMYELYN